MLLGAYYEGLTDRIKDQLVAVTLPSDLDKQITLSILVDNSLSKRARETGSGPLFTRPPWPLQSFPLHATLPSQVPHQVHSPPPASKASNP